MMTVKDQFFVILYLKNKTLTAARCHTNCTGPGSEPPVSPTCKLLYAELASPSSLLGERIMHETVMNRVLNQTVEYRVNNQGS